MKKLQDKDDVDSVVCAFDMDSPALLMLPQERQIHLEDEVDYLVDCPFTDEIRQMRAEDFIRNIIIGTFHAAYVVVGTDFQFGYNKEGDIYMLAQYQERYGMRIILSAVPTQRRYWEPETWIWSADFWAILMESAAR